VYGIVSGLGVLGLAAASEATKEDQVPSLPLGVGATVLVAVSGPVTAVGAASARRGGGVVGAQGVRIAGWIGYGLTLLDATTLIFLGLAEVEPIDGIILSVGLLGASSLACFSTDAFISASQANAAIAAAPPPRLKLELTPAIGFMRTPRGALAPTLGMRGVF